jgi:hypothetical protein
MTYRCRMLVCGVNEEIIVLISGLSTKSRPSCCSLGWSAPRARG